MNTAVAETGHPEAGSLRAIGLAVEEFVEHEAIRPLEVYNRYVYSWLEGQYRTRIASE